MQPKEKTKQLRIVAKKISIKVFETTLQPMVKLDKNQSIRQGDLILPTDKNSKSFRRHGLFTSSNQQCLWIFKFQFMVKSALKWWMWEAMKSQVHNVKKWAKLILYTYDTCHICFLGKINANHDFKDFFERNMFSTIWLYSNCFNWRLLKLHHKAELPLWSAFSVLVRNSDFLAKLVRKRSAFNQKSQILKFWLLFYDECDFKIIYIQDPVNDYIWIVFICKL